MSLFKNVKSYKTRSSTPKEVLLLCGFGGSVWQTRRLVSVLQKAGYNVTALDFPKEVLSKGDPTLLPQLVDEVVAFANSQAKKFGKPILLVGISLGALIALNIIRRSESFTEGVLITGGDIAKIARSIYGAKVWPQSYRALANAWQNINMYTAPRDLVGKRLLFVLPARDDLIDTSDIYREVKAQANAGNHLVVVTRRSFGHIGTIIEETILFPKRVLAYIDQVMEV